MSTQKHIFVLSCLFFFSFPLAASAATISFQATPANIGAGDIARIDVLFESSISANAFSGILLYPPAILEPVAVNDGSSIINLWITRPVISTAGEPIAFAGITPGGFSGNEGVLFSILFQAKAAGTAEISHKDIAVLRNDGLGGKEQTTKQSLTLSVGARSSGGYTEPIDNTPPEPFTAYLGNDSQLFDGRNYLVFTATDKISGIKQYTVAESRLPSFLFPFFPPSWNTISASPYVISDQRLISTVYIKAIDRAGNERLSVFPPQHLFTAYEKAGLLVILMVVVLLHWRGRGRRFRNPL